jgi:hypothetical protein
VVEEDPNNVLPNLNGGLPYAHQQNASLAQQPQIKSCQSREFPWMHLDWQNGVKKPALQLALDANKYTICCVLIAI